MYDFRLLILFGPFAMTATAAAALLVAWRSLSRVPHLLMWSAAFAVMAGAVLVRGFLIPHEGVAPRPAASIMLLLAVSTTVLLAQGFASRAGQGGFLRRTASLWIAVAAGIVLLHGVAAPRALPTALAATAEALALAWSATYVVREGRRPGIAETVALLVLLVVALLRLWIGLTALGPAFGPPSSGGHGWVPAIMIEPACIALVGMFLIASDLSGELNRIALTDPLTRVMNRAGFEDAALRAVGKARFPDRPLALAIADIDRFKAINDAHGHAAGDAALSSFAGAMSGMLGRQAMVGRIGGEEFAVLLPAHSAYEALARIEGVRARAETMAIGEGRMHLTASFGIAELAPGESLADLLARADQALYRSKECGRNRCSLAPIALAD